MSLTVSELTDIPFLRTTLHAGHAGADRRIEWAHSTEIAEPWEWLEADVLLMTIGIGIPASPKDQVAYIENLAEVGVSGIAISECRLAPPLSAEMIDAAERCAFPILLTAFEIPMVRISRAIAAFAQGDEQSRLVTTSRIYNHLRAALASHRDPAILLHALESEISCRLSVCDDARAIVLFAGSQSPTQEDLLSFREALNEREGFLPGMMRLRVNESLMLVVKVPSRRPTSLLAVPQTPTIPAISLLQHVATVTALELERLWAFQEESRRLGSELFSQLLDRGTATAAPASALGDLGLSDVPLMVAVTSSVGDSAAAELHHDLTTRGISSLVLQRGQHLHVLLSATDDALASLSALLTDAHRLGISSTFQGADGLATAVHEARWAYETTSTEGRRSLRFGDTHSLFGPRSIPEARIAVSRALGPVLAYDQEHESNLVGSLRAFLTCNRSWQRASEELFIHKQTLVYRMRRVEELTGYKLNDTADIAELWLALQALEKVPDVRTGARVEGPTSGPVALSLQGQ